MNNENFEVQRDFWFACVDIDVLEDNRLTPIEKVIFCLLCRYVNLGSRDCFPSIKKLAEKANCSEFSVKKALKRLAELGLIERQERFINGRQTTSLYTIIGFKAPYYKNKSEAEGGSTKLTPPSSTLTHEGQSDVPPINDIQNNDIIYSTREADLPNSTDIENEKQEPDKKEENNSLEKQDICPLNEAPEILQPVVCYLFFKTGRKTLFKAEIEALKFLAEKHTPKRIKHEIDTSIERFLRKNKHPATLRFEYIASALSHQTSLKPKKRADDDAKIKEAAAEFKAAEARPDNVDLSDEAMDALRAEMKEWS